MDHVFANNPGLKPGTIRYRSYAGKHIGAYPGGERTIIWGRGEHVRLTASRRRRRKKATVACGLPLNDLGNGPYPTCLQITQNLHRIQVRDLFPSGCR